MTKFLSFYNLCSFHTQDFLGIAEDHESGSIIATVGRNIAIVFNLATQKQTQSWSTVEKLTSKVVFDRLSQKYVGLFANQFLRCWDKNVSNINKCKKIKFKRSILDLVVSDQDTLILYNDGNFERLSHVLRGDARRKAAPEDESPPEYTLKNACTFQLQNQHNFLAYFAHNNKTEDVELVRVSLENGETTRFPLKRKELDVRIAGRAIIQGENAPMLITIWSDKRIFLLSLEENTKPNNSPGNFISTLTEINVDSPLSLMAVSRNYVVIYGSNSTQEGASLILYNTQYSVLKTKQFFKVYFDSSQLWCMADRIILAMGQNISVVSYIMSKDTLEELVGAHKGAQHPLDDHINEVETLQDSLKFRKTTNGFILHRYHKNNKQNKSSKDITKNVRPFESGHDINCEINSINSKLLNTRLFECCEQSQRININILYGNERPYRNPVIEIIEHQLVHYGASEYEITEKLLLVLMETNQIEDMRLCLARYSNVSEKALAKCLGYVLKKLFEANIAIIRQEEGKELKIEYVIDKIVAEVHSPETIELFDLLSAIIGYKFNAALVAPHIRAEIDLPQVIVLLEHLYYLTTHDVGSNSMRFVGSLEQLELPVIRWFSVLLNTHFQKLALSKSAQIIELLSKWRAVLVAYQSEAADLRVVAALLTNIVREKAVLASKNHTKWYAIEEFVY